MRITDLALRLLGATSGEQIIKAAAAASGAITLPAGTTDFSGAGPGVVKQASAGAAFTVAPVAATEVTGLAGLTADALIKGGGAGAAPVASTATVDGSGNMAVTGSLTAGSASSGPTTINAGNDPLTLQTGSAAYCRIILADGATRTWAVGPNTAGHFTIGDNSAPAIRLQINTDGSCYSTNGTWSSLSDARLKQDIEPYERGLAAILALNPVSFKFNGHMADGVTRYGLVADDVADVVPEVVGEVDLAWGPEAESMTVKTVDPGRLIYAVINSCKELAAMNAALSARIEALEARGGTAG